MGTSAFGRKRRSAVEQTRFVEARKCVLEPPLLLASKHYQPREKNRDQKAVLGEWCDYPTRKSARFTLCSRSKPVRVTREQFPCLHTRLAVAGDDIGLH